MPDQSLLLLEILERVLTDVQLLFITKRLRVRRVVPCIDVIPTQLNNLQTMQQVLTAAGKQNGDEASDCQKVTYLYVLDFGLLLMLLFQVLIQRRQFFNILQTRNEFMTQDRAVQLY